MAFLGIVSIAIAAPAMWDYDQEDGLHELSARNTNYRYTSEGDNSEKNSYYGESTIF